MRLNVYGKLQASEALIYSPICGCSLFEMDWSCTFWMLEMWCIPEKQSLICSDISFGNCDSYGLCVKIICWAITVKILYFMNISLCWIWGLRCVDCFEKELILKRKIPWNSFFFYLYGPFVFFQTEFEFFGTV